jgi:pseudouridine-5'-phosphate glycosidase
VQNSPLQVSLRCVEAGARISSLEATIFEHGFPEYGGASSNNKHSRLQKSQGQALQKVLIEIDHSIFHYVGVGKGNVPH